MKQKKMKKAFLKSLITDKYAIAPIYTRLNNSSCKAVMCGSKCVVQCKMGQPLMFFFFYCSSDIANYDHDNTVSTVFPPFCEGASNNVTPPLLPIHLDCFG